MVWHIYSAHTVNSYLEVIMPLEARYHESTSFEEYITATSHYYAESATVGVRVFVSGFNLDWDSDASRADAAGYCADTRQVDISI